MPSFRADRGVVSIAVSIHRVTRKSGERFVVRYRDPTGMNRSRAFATRAEAERYERQITTSKSSRRGRKLRADLERF